jgi:peptide/nickel transport system substrate-binding protein
VRWHDGTPFTADDVAFSIGYYQTHVLGRFTTSANKVAEVEVGGDLEVSLTLARARRHLRPDRPGRPADAPAPRVGGHRRAPHHGEAMGTGPYRLVEYQSDQYYRLEANADYWGPDPAFDTIIAAVIRDETATFQALQAGEIDVAVRPVPARLPSSASRLRADIAVQQGAGFPSTILIMDVTQPGLDDAACVA